MNKLDLERKIFGAKNSICQARKLLQENKIILAYNILDSVLELLEQKSFDD